MPTQTRKKLPRQVFTLQALYFESLKRVPDLTELDRERLQEDLRYAKAGHHLWQLGLGWRRPRVPRIIYLPATVDRALSVITVKLPGESLPDKPRGDVTDFDGYLPLHDPNYLLLAIHPSARESDIVSAVKKQIQAIKKRSGKARSAGGGRKHSIDRMKEALQAYAHYHRKQDRLLAYQLGRRAQTFQPILINERDLGPEHFKHQDRGYKLLQLAEHMIDTARKGSSAWVAAFPYVYEEPLP